VNGYYCRTCADVALAKRGVDPARSKQEELESLRRPTIELGDNRPSAPGSELGSRLNVFA
jgi:hypothetical protein